MLEKDITIPQAWLALLLTAPFLSAALGGALGQLVIVPFVIKKGERRARAPAIPFHFVD